MSKSGTTRITVKVRRPHAATRIVNAMTDEDVPAARALTPTPSPSAPEELAKMQRISPVKALLGGIGTFLVESCE
jgi:hypothetical protein